MPRILLVKTSSLGDVVHNLPVVSDIARAYPGAEIDWVVEEGFVALPALHARVTRVLPVAVRRWRRTLAQGGTWREMRAFAEGLRASAYDAIVDTQGLFKSAVLARLARGQRFGLDFRASREPLAPFYDRTIHVPRGLHAVARNRTLAAEALRYAPPPMQVDYGIRAQPQQFDWLPTPYVVLMHATSAQGKLWPDAHWIELGRHLSQAGFTCVLPWGHENERARSERYTEAISGARVPPRLALDQVASLLAGAAGGVGVDTGLTHLCAALGVPTVGIYVATEPATTGVEGARAANLGGTGQQPVVSEVLRALERLQA